MVINVLGFGALEPFLHFGGNHINENNLQHKFGESLSKSEGKIEEMEKFVNKMREEFRKMKEELESNSSADEERERKLRELIHDECGIMRERFLRLFEEMKVRLHSLTYNATYRLFLPLGITHFFELPSFQTQRHDTG